MPRRDGLIVREQPEVGSEHHEQLWSGVGRAERNKTQPPKAVDVQISPSPGILDWGASGVLPRCLSKKLVIESIAGWRMLTLP